MANNRIKPTPRQGAPLPTTLPGGDTIRFSFKFLDETDDAFQFEGNQPHYFLKLLQRLRDMSRLEMSDVLRNLGQHKGMRCHPIDWSETTRVNGFGIPIDGADANAWQFSLTSNEHGRVHGFLIESTFFVVWLDPQHNLYP